MTSPPRPAEELLQGYPVVVELPVQWGEQDALGHVNHAVYFRWYESARLAYWERIGLAMPRGGKGTGPILASVANDYRRQLRYPDSVLVGVRIARFGRTSLGMEHRIVSKGQGALAAEGTSTLVLFDYEANRPVHIPADIRKAVEDLEGRPLS